MNWKIPYLLGAGLGMLIALILILFSEPVYDAEATLRIGSFGIPIAKDRAQKTDQDIQFIEEPGRVKQVLRSRYRVREAKTRQLDFPYLYAIREGDAQDILNLSARGRSPEEAIELLNSILDWVTERHTTHYDQFINQLREQSKYLESIFYEAGYAQAQSVLSNDRIKPLSTLREPELSHSDAMLYAMRMMPLSDLVKNNVYRGKTEILSKPHSTGKKISPRVLLYIITGIVVGAFSVVALIGISREIEALIQKYR